MTNSPKRIILTGGSGFLGTHLCEALTQAGHTIKNIDLRESAKFPTTIADVRDAQLMKQEIREADIVFHLASLIEAGESVEQPAKYVDYNINGTVSVLEAMRQNNIKTFIFSSSAAVYGEPTKVPIFENDPTTPINPYGMTKLAMEGLLSSYINAFGFSGAALRYFNLYGPQEHHQPETHAIPRFIDQIQTGQEVTVWGEGDCKRDYVYITDIVDAHLKAIEYVESKPGEFHYFNLSTEKAYSVMEIISTLEDILSKKANIKHFPPRPGDPQILVADASKARRELGWSSKVDIEEGLKKTVEYFSSL